MQGIPIVTLIPFLNYSVDFSHLKESLGLYFSWFNLSEIKKKNRLGLLGVVLPECSLPGHGYQSVEYMGGPCFVLPAACVRQDA